MKSVSLTSLTTQAVSHQANISKKVMIENGEVPHLTNFSQASLQPGERVEPHRHAKYEVFLVESGDGEMRVEGKMVNLYSGMCVVVEPNELHEIVVFGSKPLVLTYFGIAADAN